MSKELEDKYGEYFKGNDLFFLKSILQLNHDPHPYTIGPKHVAYAADNWGGSLGANAIREGEQINAIKCAHPNCNIPYSQHKYDTVMAIQLMRHGTNKEGDTFLKDLVKKFDKTDKIDGFVMVETKEEYRLT